MNGHRASLLESHRLIALAIATGDQRDGIGDFIPQEVWDALHDEGLVETLRDITGDGFTNTTPAGLEVLVDAIEGNGDA